MGALIALDVTSAKRKWTRHLSVQAEPARRAEIDAPAFEEYGFVFDRMTADELLPSAKRRYRS
jgi:hypothetical protein